MFVEKLKNTLEWDNFVKQTPGGTFYHSTKWKTVIEKTFKDKTNYIMIKDINGEIVGIFPMIITNMGYLKIINSLPYSDVGGPVIKENKIKEASNIIINYLKNSSINNKISFANICFMEKVIKKYFILRPSIIIKNKGIIKIDLNKNCSDYIWKNILKKRDRNFINRFSKDGYQIREVLKKSDMYKFIEVYKLQCQYLQIKSYPKEFFINMWDILYPENFNILLVEKERTIGGIAFFKFGLGIYLTYLGMNRQLLTNRYRLWPYLCWESIKWAEENGFRYVDLGATSSDPKNIHYKNKMKFGGTFYQQEEVYIPFNLSVWIYLMTMLKSIEMWRILRKKLPIKINRIIEEKMKSSLIP